MAPAKFSSETTAASFAEHTSAAGGGGGGGGAGGGGHFFARAEGTQSPNTDVVGLLFDVDPRDPVVISVFAAVIFVLVGALWFTRVFSPTAKRGARRAQAPARGEESGDRSGIGGVDNRNGSELSELPPSRVAERRYNTRGHRTTTPSSRSVRTDSRASSQRSAGQPAKVVLTPEQLQLCEVLYDVYMGVVPPSGIESKPARDSELSTAEIRRQFQNIKKARAATGGKASPDNVLLTSPLEPSSGRSTATKARNPAQGEKKTLRRPAVASPKKPPVSPKKSPVKRGAATMPPPSSPAPGGRPSKKRSPSVPALAVPASPMVTRGKNHRTPSVRIGSPKSTPTKRVAAAAVGTSSSSKSGGGTPPKKAKLSVLEIARREAQQHVADTASTRASSLRGDGSGSLRKAKS